MTDTQLECWGVFRCWHGQETVLAVYPNRDKAFTACDQLIQLFQVDGEPDCSPEIYKTESPKFLENKS